MERVLPCGRARLGGIPSDDCNLQRIRDKARKPLPLFSGESCFSSGHCWIIVVERPAFKGFCASFWVEDASM
jgi:hypothetical protein